ncbi:amphiphysin isoform X15 [Tachysurus ichikawai]
MAEIKTGIFAKNVQKKLNRAQEKVLQKLGKADETKDEQFEQCVQNFKRQESEGSRLQREMRAYIAAVKGMQQASMNLTESLHEVYEPDWHGKDDVISIAKSCDVLWEDFHQKLVDSTILALDAYLIQFPDIKIRVAKRSRKLIDYDSARHHLETLQTSAIKNDKKIAKAEEDLKKAQKVFDDLNVDLQDELPSLWDSRVGFYVKTFKSVSSLEAKFHREISVFCHKLYEVMNKLAEQHPDKMFTIQGAPSDSGPLRLARTPTPPEDESPEVSPASSPNHTLRPTSPGPPRPKSPSQLKMGPPKPPPPKVTPTKEIPQEEIINLFDGGFPEISVTSPQPNENPTESLLDLDFDPFKPDSNTTIGQTAAQALSWDLWTTNTEAQPASDSGFNDNWTADFGSAAQDVGDAQPATDGQGWPPADGWPTDTVPQEEATGEVRRDTKYDQEPNPDCEECALKSGKIDPPFNQQLVQDGTEEGWESEQSCSDTLHSEWTGDEEVWTTETKTKGLDESRAGKSMPGIIFTNEFGQEIAEATGGCGQGLYTEEEENNPKWYLTGQGDLDGSGSEYETAEEWADASGQNSGWISADDELEYAENKGPIKEHNVTSSKLNQENFVDDIESSFMEQSTIDAASFIGHSVITNCDRLAKTESTKPSDGRELGHHSLTNYVSTADLTHSNKQNEIIDNSVSKLFKSKFCSEPHCKSECVPFSSGPDLFAASEEDPFGTGNDSFAHLDKGWFCQENCQMSEKFANDSFAMPRGDVFRSKCQNTNGQAIGFESYSFEEGYVLATEITSNFSPSETNQEHFASETSPPFEGKTDHDPFAKENEQDPFASETLQDPFDSETNWDPFASENNQDYFTSEALFASKTDQDPFAIETNKDNFVSEIDKDPFATKTNQDSSDTEPVQNLFASETKWDPFASKNGQDTFISETNRDPFVSETNQDSFASEASETNQDPFASENNQDPFVSENNQDPFVSETNQDPFATETIQDPFTSETNWDPFTSRNNQHLFPSKTKQDHLDSETDKDLFTSENNHASYTTKSNQDAVVSETNPDLFFGQTNHDPFASETKQDLFASETNQDPFASETNQDPLDSETSETNQDPFDTETVQDPFTSETNWDPFASRNNQHLFPSKTKQDHLDSETDKDHFTSENNHASYTTKANQDLFFGQTNHDPFAGETKQDLFVNETDQDPFASETNWDPFGSENDNDPFTYESNLDPFSNENQDPFASDKQDPFASETNHETNQDLFVSGTNQITIIKESTQESLASEGNQGWAESWESTMIGQASCEVDFSTRNRSAHWAAFPSPTAELESSSKDSWQEMNDTGGSFPSDVQGDIIKGWPGDSGPNQDTYNTCYGQNNIPCPKNTAMEKTASVKEPENSDLSEDEVANRRYGKLYQEIDAEKDEVSHKALSGLAQSEAPEGVETGTEAAQEEVEEGEGEVSPTQAPEAEGSVTTPPAETTAEPPETTAASSPPAETASSIVESPEAAETMAAEQTETTPADDTEKEQLSPEALESAPVAEPGVEPPTEALAPAEDKESPIEETPTIETKPEDETGTVDTNPEDDTAIVEVEPEEYSGTVEVEPEGETGTVEVKPEGETGTIEVEPEGETGTVEVIPGNETSNEGATKNFEEEDKMPIPSVVIEPASSNEGDDDRDGDIVSPVATSGDGVTPDSQTAKDISSSGMPPGFLYKVETMHDFEAANSDELDLKRGDIVLVVPTELVEDQDAGWLTGIRERDWLHQGASAQKGLFPENFIQRLG